MTRFLPSAAALWLGLVAGQACAQSFALSEPSAERWSARWVLGTTSTSADARPASSLLADRFFWGPASLASEGFMRARPGHVAASSGDSTASPHTGFRASGGLVMGAGSARLGALSAWQGTPAEASWGVGAGAALAGYQLRTDASLVRPGADDALIQPYLGLGYSHAAADGSWGLSADIGMVATRTDTWQDTGRALFGPGRLDEAVRNLKMRPVMQLGLRYRF